jgi:hypothetical protein
MIILAAAAALIALPASAQSIRVSTEGKSTAQVRAEVFQAARKLCNQDVPGSAYRVEETRSCTDRTVRVTLAQSRDPSLRLASR